MTERTRLVFALSLAATLSFAAGYLARGAASHAPIIIERAAGQKENRC